MSTSYYGINPIEFSDLIKKVRADGRITVETHSDDPDSDLSPDDHVVLGLDGQYIHARKVEETTDFTRYGLNDVELIINILSYMFDSSIYDEDEIAEDSELQEIFGWDVVSDAHDK